MKLVTLSAITMGLLPLTACVGTGDGRSVPLFPVPGSGGGGSGGTPIFKPAPAEPMAPSVLLSESDIYSEQYEKHGAADASDCYQMEQRFKSEGRKIRLVKVVRNYLNSGGGVLEFLCLFDGEDAEVESSAFEDYRYNRPDEYNSP